MDQARRDLLRRAHEHFHIPVAMLADLAGYLEGTVDKLARAQKWSSDGSGLSLRKRLADLMDTTVDTLQTGQGDSAEIDRTIRAISSLMKAVESLVTMEAKQVNALPQFGQTDSDDNYTLAVGNGKDIARLDTLLATLARRVDEEEAGSSCPDHATTNSSLPDDPMATAGPVGAKNG